MLKQESKLGARLEQGQPCESVRLPLGTKGVLMSNENPLHTPSPQVRHMNFFILSQAISSVQTEGTLPGLTID